VKSHISIRTFSILFVIFFTLIALVSIYKMQSQEKANISKIISSDLQSSILSLSFILKQNLKKDNNISKIKAKLDNFQYQKKIIKNIYISNQNNKIIYSHNKTNLPLPKNFCTDLNNLNTFNLLKKRGCKQKVIVYKGTKKINYEIYIITNHQDIKKLIYSPIYDFFYFFIPLFFILLLLVWLYLEKIIILPLEKLRQFAYYHLQEPKEFLIKELESIRYSLGVTFNRLENEQKELYKLSTKDTLSGLYNRLSLFDNLSQLIAKAKRERKEFAVLFMDLDNFKDINDYLGHDVGDDILKYISSILLKSVRENDFVSRIGGDEFVVILPEFESNIKIVEIAQRIIENISKPIEKESEVLYVSASVGIVIYPKDGENVAELIKNADIAMYKAKELGKNQFHFFTEELHNNIEQKISIQNAMKDALEKGYFELYYQPKVDIKEDKIVSCEALVRWNDPKKGVIAPDLFIQIAEENGFIIKLGEWVMKEGAKQIKKWHNTELHDLKVSLNVSAYQFYDPKFYDKVLQATKQIDISKFDLEITESAFLKDTNKNIKTIEQIKDIGISLSLDDFGTGFSSLSYLRQIPVDTLKIDKSFIDAYNEINGESFIALIVNIGKILGLNIVAEGVESKKQLDFLKEIGCSQVQGYYYSKPLPIKDFEKLYKKYNKI